jgi:hypothetical protein
VLGRRAFPAYGTLPVLAGMAAWGTAALLPPAALELWATRPSAVGPGQAALVLYLGAGCSALTYGLWGYALRHLEAGRAAAFDALIPVVGVAAAVLVLREAPPAWHLVGGALVAAGVGLAAREPAPAVAAATNRTQSAWTVRELRPRASAVRPRTPGPDVARAAGFGQRRGPLVGLPRELARELVLGDGDGLVGDGDHPVYLVPGRDQRRREAQVGPDAGEEAALQLQHTPPTRSTRQAG